MTLELGGSQHVKCWQAFVIYSTRLQLLSTLESSKLFWCIEGWTTAHIGRPTDYQTSSDHGVQMEAAWCLSTPKLHRCSDVPYQHSATH